MKVIGKIGALFLFLALLISVFYVGRYVEDVVIAYSCNNSPDRTWINGQDFYCVDFRALNDAIVRREQNQHKQGA